MPQKTMRFHLRADSKHYEGKVNCPDDDGTTTLPMMLFTLIKELSKDPHLHAVKAITIEASTD